MEEVNKVKLIFTNGEWNRGNNTFCLFPNTVQVCLYNKRGKKAVQISGIFIYLSSYLKGWLLFACYLAFHSDGSLKFNRRKLKGEVKKMFLYFFVVNQYISIDMFYQ